jgi:hypothetical protein
VIIESVDGSILKTVLLRFYNNISPSRIHKFYAFRKYAYDYQIISKAFKIASEGKSFYENLFDRDGSPYILQQAALYLSKKKKHGEAFSMIDRAINVSKGRIWSIRNSHAIILFKANIDHSHDPGALASLKESMAILSECYKWDKRKLYHAITFARHALSYSSAHSGEDALNFLKTASEWLTIEQRNSPWNRDVKQLLNSVEKELRTYN